MQLQDFPFDLDSIEVQFSTSSLWQTNDGAKQGSALKGKTYRLRPVNAGELSEEEDEEDEEEDEDFTDAEVDAAMEACGGDAGIDMFPYITATIDIIPL